MRCTREGVAWSLIPSSAVSRALRVCDPDELLPTSPTVATALSTLRTELASDSDSGDSPAAAVTG
ncbi:hypothetical protein ACWDTP_22475 [Mycobacterium sp. NPDC003449]